MSSIPEGEAAGDVGGHAASREPTLAEQVRAFTTRPFGRALSRYALLRFVLLRAVGFVYAIGFAILVLQARPLIGANGLLPARDYLDWAARVLGSRGAAFWRLPTLFWVGASDGALTAAAWVGLLLSLVVVAGYANAPIFLALWALYLSFVHVGQIFYGYGWESLLCEAGFLCVFLAPTFDPRPFPERSPPPEIAIVLFRWLTFRVMLGAGLIKLRGDPCWRDLTCLVYHYETQPNPGPLSYYFHRLPLFVHELGVLFNHLVELVAPFGVFGPRPLRLAAGALIVIFQVALIASGNLSFLNWLTIAVALSCFDDGVVWRLFPQRVRRRAAELEHVPPSRARRATLIALALGIGFLSINPVVNLLSARQAMNASFDPFMLVNTYGAFGSVGRERHEIVIEGTRDDEPSATTHWLEYELPCKPGDPMRRPCWITPYHYRLDWQMWFVPFGGIENQPWLVHLIAKLLAGDRSVLSLFARNPFPNAPPRFIRVALYRYRFTRPGESGYWHREYLGEFLRPMALDDPQLRRYLALHHFH